MCLLLREAMTVGKIALAREFFSNELGTAAAKTRIKDELSSYCVVTEAPKTTFGKVRCRAFLFCPTDALSASVVCLIGAPDVHRQALRQAGRSLHRHAAQPHRLPEVLAGLQVPQLPRTRLPHTQWTVLLSNTHAFSLRLGCGGDHPEPVARVGVVAADARVVQPDEHLDAKPEHARGRVVAGEGP